MTEATLKSTLCCIYFYKFFRNITISKYFLIEIYCPFVMHYYPFDRQSCEILIVNRGIVKDNVELIAEELIYNGPEDYLEYFIQEPTFTTDENNTLRVKMVLKRRILNVASNTFLPVILIVLVSLCFEYTIILQKMFKSMYASSLHS